MHTIPKSEQAIKTVEKLTTADIVEILLIKHLAGLPEAFVEIFNIIFSHCFYVKKKLSSK